MLKKWYKHLKHKHKRTSNHTPTSEQDVGNDEQISLPQGAEKKENKWGRIEYLTLIYVVISAGALGASIYAVSVTVKTLDGKHSVCYIFEAMKPAVTFVRY